tara:strand:- start:1064 stop:4276 length:3213 start_codon:yes stop_codon:yes gene_type:complete
MAEKDFRVRKGLVVDGTSSATSVAVTTGNVVVAAGTIGLTDGLLLSTVAGSPNVSKITSQPTNGNIHIEPNGDGDIVLVTDNLDVTGDSMKISIKDNVAAALDITEASNSYLKFTTTNGSDEADSGLITFGKDSTFASTNIHNLGTVSAATSITSTAFVGPLTGDVTGNVTGNVDGIIGGTSPAAGSFTSLDVDNGDITNVGDIDADSISVADATAGLNIDFSGANTGTAKITLKDAAADALSITDGSADFMVFNTDGETITFGKNSTFAGTTIADLGTVTTADINSGTIDGTTIGGSAQAAATVTVFKAKNTGYISRVNALQNTTRFQVDGLDTGAGAGAGTSPSSSSTAAYAEARLFSDLKGDDYVSQWNDYSGMSGTLIIDNADDVPEVGQGTVLTIGDTGGTGDSWAMGRMLLSSNSDFTIGYYPKPYEDIGYKNSSTNAPNVFNPFRAAQSVFKIEKTGDVTLKGIKGDTVDGSTAAHIFNPVSLKFQGVDSGGTTRFTGFTIPSQLAASNSIYTLPDAYPSGSSKVLQSTTSGALSWVSASGTVSALNSQLENRLVTMGSDTTQLDGEAKATLDGHKMLLGEQSGSGETTSAESDPHLHIVRRQNVDIGSGLGSQILGAKIQAIDVADGHNASHGVSVTGLNVSALQTNTAGGTSATSKALQLSATGSTNNYAIYSSAGDAYFQSSVDNTPPQLTLAHIFNDTSGPVMNFLLDKGSAGTDDDVLGQILFKGDDSDQNTTTYAAIKADVANAASGSEEGRLTFQMAQQSDGSLIDVMVIDGGDLANGTHSKVVIKGDLQVDGDTTTVNTAVLEVEDLNITVAKNAANAAAANGAGLTVAGASATLIYASSGDRWNFNKDLSVAGALSADTSFTLDSTTISTAEIAVLDGIALSSNVPTGAVTADKALTVDANKDLNDSSNHLRDVRMRNLTSTGSVTSTQFSSDYGDIKTVQVASGQIAIGASVTVGTIDTTAYRGAEVLTTVYNTTDNTTDLFKTVVMWDGHDTQIQADDKVHYTNYAVLSSGDVASGDISAVRDGTDIDVNFTSSADSADTFIIRAQLILLDI